MKNLLKTIGLLIVLAGLFSCQTASIMKRHYNKGYYVSKKHKASEPVATNRITTEKAPALEPAVIENIVRNSEDHYETARSTAQAQETPKALKRSSKKLKILFSDENPLSYSFAPKGIVNHPFEEGKNLKEAMTKDDVARDALSLLWILILVLLILYVVGLIFDLFGLGPVFHILGLIVLILFILWILRVI